MLSYLSFALALGLSQAHAQALPNDYLVKLKVPLSNAELSMFAGDSRVEHLQLNNWIRLRIPADQVTTESLNVLRSNPMVEYVQPNYPVHLLNDYREQDPVKRALLETGAKAKPPTKAKPTPAVPADNPAIPAAGQGQDGVGADPQFANQWGMNDIGVKTAWAKTKGIPQIVVAVIDTGVDYTHEDLMGNIWHNPGESGNDAQGRDKSSNGVDDDSNGYVDDVIGWDFASNDNKPYDMTVDPMKLLMGGGNPGHGTHCAGNVGARADNGKGIAGVAPNIRIMPVRFLNETGQGDTAGAVKAIMYAVKNGARVLSNSWGSEGEDSDASSNKALKDAIDFARSQGVLFVAAAGNGHNGVGYDNDSDSKPGIPASYNYDNIVSVAAIDKSNQLGSFSNWGLHTVHIGAPGVDVFSTMVGNRYSDVVVDMPEYGIHVTWDGTSMATPHVAGAAALYWSLYPNKTYKEVKDALLNSATKINALAGKTVTGGKLNVAGLMNQ